MVLDTNFLVAPYKFKVDAFSQIAGLVEGKAEYVLLSSCAGEINSLPLREKIAAKSGIELLKKHGLQIEKDAGGKPDDEIVAYAKENAGNCAVATLDADLRRRLRGIGVRSIFMRQEKFLKMD